MTTHYATLELAPAATAEEIEAAYQRLSYDYDPARFASAAADIRALAAQRYAAIATAYATLYDASARAAYDALLAEAPPEPPELDYMPLSAPGTAAVTPPMPLRMLNGWRLLAGCLALIGVATALLVWRGMQPPVAVAPAEMPLFAQMILQDIPDQTVRDQLLSLDAVATQAQRQTQLNPRSTVAWVGLGNAYYDFMQTIYEAAPEGQAYALNADRWLRATEAYSQALQIDPLQPVVRSDLALATIRYGLVLDNQPLMATGLAEAERALADDNQTPQVLVNAGRAYALTGNPAEARQLWQRVVAESPGSNEAALATRLLQGGRP